MHRISVRRILCNKRMGTPQAWRNVGSKIDGGIRVHYVCVCEETEISLLGLWLHLSKGEYGASVDPKVQEEGWAWATVASEILATKRASIPSHPSCPTYHPSREPWACLFLLKLLHNISQGGLPGQEEAKDPSEILGLLLLLCLG